ncbi:MAG: 2-oxoglutarate dehydrogenase complex dihydrolipoyllysine-residue succinyltransferase [Bacteroidetes bacterium]|jgi:2-oxoglutarate dehydrogenase E2 component (dihydrolipoamide succinyltransferase)|nr:2-oxoglutarate dehydrogenase complex dihydrolipoyllysine-residue succinyltransferase [Bacteroidota bacterium]
MLKITVPSPGESITEVTIDAWLKTDGQYVERDEPLADIQSDKAMLTVYAEDAGILQIKAKAGDTVAVGAVIAEIDTDAKAPATTAQPKQEGVASSATPVAATATASPAVATHTYATGVPSPAAERVLHEKGLKPEDVTGTGRDGRITKADALQATAPAIQPGNGASPQAQATIPAAPTGSRTERAEKMSQLRKTLAKRLVAAKNDTAMLTTFNEVDMSAILDLRKQYKDRFKEVHGIGLGFMGLFGKACAQALMEFPQVNAYLDGDSLLFHDYVDIGIAVSTERGLVVPVVRGVEQLSVAEIEQSIGDIAKKARENRITIADMQGGTFTITNGGVFGSLLSTPILNPPQSAILGMHKIEERPMALNGQVVIRPMMYLALSYDHRVIDGKESVSFLVRVKEYLEDPIRLMLGV